MIEEEFKTNQTFKYPEEYDIYDGAAEGSLKKNFGGDVVQPSKGEYAWKKPDFSREAEIIQEFKERDNLDRRFAKEEKRNEAAAMQALEHWLAEKSLEYHSYMVKRSKLLIKDSERETLRTKLARFYQLMINHEEHGEIARKRFPHISYGQDVNSKTFK